jgi:hypothetical protein
MNPTTVIDTQTNQSVNMDTSYAIRIDNSGPTFDINSTYDFDPKYKKSSSSLFDSTFDKDTWYNETVT